MTYLQPAILFFILLIATGLIGYRSRRCRRIGMAGLVLLFLWSWPPAAWLIAGSLEWLYPVGYPVKTQPDGGDAQAIVVLGGSVFPPNPSHPEQSVGWDTHVRIQHAAWLYRHWHPLPVVLSGGPGQDSVPIARTMRKALEAEGVPPSAIFTEEQSTSTYENALYTGRLLLPRGITRIALVTHAQHMLRGDLCFRKQGFTVIPVPCAYRTLEFNWDAANLMPGSGKVIQSNGDALHEWIGLAWYKLKNRI